MSRHPSRALWASPTPWPAAAFGGGRNRARRLVHRMGKPMDPNAIASLLGSPGLVSRIGNTPLVPIRGLDGVGADVEVWGKAEWLNPGGSVKDRAAWAMIEEGEASGFLAPGKTLIDATSGNTGIAYAWIGAARSFAVELCVPANAGAARRRL